MKNLICDENWAARERLRRVEFLLWWRGWVGRQDLVGVFGISPAQASGDLQRYAEMNPGAMVYHTSRKRYESAKGMRCVLHKPSFDEAVRGFFGGGPGVATEGAGGEAGAAVAVVGLPERSVRPAVARMVLTAMLDGRSLRVNYLSVHSGTAGWREISPRGLAWDGRRWHARAWCAKNREWRDFVLGRMTAAEWPGDKVDELPEDADWNTIEKITLVINPKLSAEQREALRVDYDLHGDRLEIRIRRCMKPYLLANMLIDHESHRKLPRHFVMGESGQRGFASDPRNQKPETRDQIENLT